MGGGVGLAEPGLCDKGQFDYFFTIRFLGFPSCNPSGFCD